MKQKSLLLVILLATMQVVNAQTADKKITLGVNLVSTKYIGDLGGNAFSDFTHSQYFLGYFSGGLTLATYLSPSFDLGIMGNYGIYGFYNDRTNNFLAKKFEATMFGHYKFNNGYILPEKSKISPFLSLGYGLAFYGNVQDHVGAANITGTDFIVPLGVGLKYQINDYLALQYQYQYYLTTNDNHDKVIKGGNDAYGEHIFSAIFSLGKDKDSDKDGVPDKKDLCPNTPLNVKVDAKGCPIDTDKDGVPDYLDKCPNTPPCAKVDANGCPVDSDGDGVPDYLDKCPDTPAGVKVDATGCPIDSDNDGVADYLDKCPNTPAGVKVDANGCPLDRDGDGVPDYLDKCPDVQGVVSNNGCPEVKTEVALPIDQGIQSIHFETNKFDIDQISKEILENAVVFLKKNPTKKLDIGGHTDNVGEAPYNVKLSNERANSVKNYLVNHGIKSSRLTAKGYGFNVPVADNATESGRAQNRRAEIKVKK